MGDIAETPSSGRKPFVQPSWFIFFFQAEDGIRDLTVTGVQTCALPICGGFSDGDGASWTQVAGNYFAEDGRIEAGKCQSVSSRGLAQRHAFLFQVLGSDAGVAEEFRGVDGRAASFGDVLQGSNGSGFGGVLGVDVTNRDGFLAGAPCQLRAMMSVDH